MPTRPAPPPWGALITAALRQAGLSAREAARRAGLSEGRWRQITSGYQVVSAGSYAPVRGPAATLARMAAVAGITPASWSRPAGPTRRPSWPRPRPPTRVMRSCAGSGK